MPRHHLNGVFIGSHAIAAGVLTRRQLRESSYRRLVHGVYADPGLPVDHRLYCTGVGLLLPPGAAIGGHSAAAWHDAPSAGPREPVTVICPPEVRWSGPRQVRVHATDLRPSDVELVDGTPVTTAVRTAWDVAVLEPLGTAVGVLDAMLRAGRLDREQLDRLVREGAGRFGVTRVRRAVEMADARAESFPESWVRVALVLAGLTPVPQLRVRHRGRFVARVDFGWPEEKVLLEYEGDHHFVGRQIDRDDERFDRLEAAGWLVIRVSAADLRDLDRVVRRVLAALAARR
ncbi:DUF559 domain-containing protein [Modestobacter sp. I12A-02628]|uniref:DUF559 domain-containing protein n=1 Tax=Goekera deserti TaxID=2497753 RepID=A0A7K3WF10_9ACTN|nr:DUF559 domain-containing protein [Goekera deserti]MPQ97982.1 DUF559 domain-containing protein [Goekera deserti]NDI48629.1 DUF559 domain-containing protein [Goekera deserti]NEL54992.1 DUF559 domain-containing protein [Goekera deserti]